MIGPAFADVASALARPLTVIVVAERNSSFTPCSCGGNEVGGLAHEAALIRRVSEAAVRRGRRVAVVDLALQGRTEWEETLLGKYRRIRGLQVVAQGRAAGLGWALRSAQGGGR